MPTKWRLGKLHHLALVALLTGLSAMAVLLGASELCACGPTAATSPANESETSQELTLSLTAPDICETEISGEALGGRRDEYGRPEYYSLGWNTPTEIQVSWAVTGGEGPYSLTIDGETRDNTGTFAGTTGTGWVSCAHEHGTAFYAPYDGYEDPHPTRYYHEEPIVDSGFKTITASVSDANGRKATATATTYVILSLPPGERNLEGGKTYRVWGTLLTVPEGIDLRFAGFIQGFPGPSGIVLVVIGTGSSIVLNDAFGLKEEARRLSKPPADNLEDSHGPTFDLGAALDDLVASRGKPPPHLGNP